MDRTFFRKVMGERPALWQAMLAFNGLGTAEASTSLCGPAPASLRSVAGLSSAQAAQLWAYPALRGPLQRAAKAHAKNTSPVTPFWDFAEESRRLALLPAEVLHRLALVFGVAAHATLMAQVVVRAERMALQQELGEDMLLYALHRGRFQMHSVPLSSSGPPSPPGLAGSTGIAGSHASTALPQRIRAYGLWALHRIQADWPEELRARKSLLASPAPPQTLAGGQTDSARADSARADAARADVGGTSSDVAYAGLWNDMKKILLKEVAPAWTPCFD